MLSSTITFLQGILIEAMLTFFLVSAVVGTAISPEAPKIGGFGIGMAIFVCMGVGGPFTGGGVKPRRAVWPRPSAPGRRGAAGASMLPRVGGRHSGVCLERWL